MIHLELLGLPFGVGLFCWRFAVLEYQEVRPDEVVLGIFQTEDEYVLAYSEADFNQLELEDLASMLLLLGEVEAILRCRVDELADPRD